MHVSHLRKSYDRGGAMLAPRNIGLISNTNLRCVLSILQALPKYLPRPTYLSMYAAMQPLAPLPIMLFAQSGLLTPFQLL